MELPDSEKGLDALSFGFSYDFLQESKGLFQIYILPSNFQPFRANSRSAFVWRVVIFSCIHAIFTQRTARGFRSKKKLQEGCKELIIVPTDTQIIKISRFSNCGHFIVQFKDEHLFILSRDFGFLMSYRPHPRQRPRTQYRQCNFLSTGSVFLSSLNVYVPLFFLLQANLQCTFSRISWSFI